jgi:predicted metal-dependent hydrolase
MQWPPPYTLKKHRLAKRVTLKTSQLGLVITTPLRFSARYIPEILENHKDWILNRLTHFPPLETHYLPKILDLKACDEYWTIDYQACASRLRIFPQAFNKIVILGKVHDPLACKSMLIHWLKHKANIFLTKRLKILSELIGLSYEKMTVRAQKTIWGSCTSKKIIHLNYKLIFLAPLLMDHILLHELCHTVELNHSNAFWELMKKFDSNTLIHRKILKNPLDLIPSWLTC